MTNGFLFINKPSGPTSHDIVDELRRITGIKKIGHAGTLDPFASGLLIVAVGREATRQISHFAKMDKTYIAKLHLGATSDTYDRTGKLLITSARGGSAFGGNCELLITDKKIEEILKKFIGQQKQIPPMYSAKKVNGKKLYELARRGIEVERIPVEIIVYYIKLKSFNLNPKSFVIETRVSSGAYIRSLAHDIGQALGCGAYLEELERTEIGNYKLENAVDINKLALKNWHNYLFQL